MSSVLPDVQRARASGVYLSNSGEPVIAGSDLMIQWVYGPELHGAQPATVDIELRDASTGNPLRTVATNAPNHGYFFWNVDQQIQPCSNAIVFVGNILAPHTSPSLVSAQFEVVRREDGDDDCCSVDEGHNAADELPPVWSVSAESATLTTALSTSTRNATMHSRNNTQKQQQQNLASIFCDMSLDDVEPLRRASDYGDDSEDSLRCARVEQRNQEVQMQKKPAEKQREKSPTSQTSSRSAATVSVQEPIVWSDYPDFICYAMNMCDTEIRRGLRQVVKNKDLDADALLESGEPAGIFCVRYLLLKHYKGKISSDVFNAIRSEIYVPHPVLLNAWRSSPLFRASQRSSVRSTQRVRRGGSAATSAAPAPEAHLRGVESAKRETQTTNKSHVVQRRQVVHAIDSEEESGRGANSMQKHSMRRPVTRLRVQNAH